MSLIDLHMKWSDIIPSNILLLVSYMLVGFMKHFLTPFATGFSFKWTQSTRKYQMAITCVNVHTNI